MMLMVVFKVVFGNILIKNLCTISHNLEEEDVRLQRFWTKQEIALNQSMEGFLLEVQ